VAAEVNGLFFPSPAFSGRVTKTTNAGMDISHVTQLESGNYSVEVLARTDAGDVVTLWRSANVHVTSESGEILSKILDWLDELIANKLPNTSVAEWRGV
jgi:multidrug efflux pump subunit AcrB